jgi:periodic tryptophan protein 2
MKFNFKLKRLCGAYYGHPLSTETTGGSQWSGANIVYDSTGNLLYPVCIECKSHPKLIIRTLLKARSNIDVAISPDDALLLVVDVKNYALLINFRRGIALHRFQFKRKVRAVEFSPDGEFISVTHGKHVQVWCAPNHMRKEFSPLILHRTYTGQADDVTCLYWSADSSVVAAGSRDCTVRIWTLQTIKNFEPVTLSGHKRAIVGVYLTTDPTTKRLDTCYSISEDGALVTWQCEYDDDSEFQVEGDNDASMDAMGNDAVDFFSGGNTPKQHSQVHGDVSQAKHLAQGTWTIKSRHYFHQERATVTSTSYCEQGQLLSVGFSSGIFGIYEMPSVSNIHTLSVGSNQLVKTCVLNRTGEWLALGCPNNSGMAFRDVRPARGHSRNATAYHLMVIVFTAAKMVSALE